MAYSNDLRVRVIQVVEGGAAARAKNSARGRGRLGRFISLATFTRCSKPINAKTATRDVPATSTQALCRLQKANFRKEVKTSSYGRARQQGPGNRQGLTRLFRVHPLVRRDLSGALAKRQRPRRAAAVACSEPHLQDDLPTAPRCALMWPGAPLPHAPGRPQPERRSGSRNNEPA
jgi:hypothetical protein